MTAFRALSDEEVKQVADLLAHLEPGYLPQRLFDEINRLHVASTVVVVPFKRTIDGLRVLLTQRGFGVTDPVWPGHWHLPGTMMRPTDAAGGYESALSRIFDGELQGMPVSTPIYVGTRFSHTRRGAEHTPLFYVFVDGDPAVGELFPVDNLPSPIIEHEVGHIAAAAESAAKNIGLIPQA